MRTDMDMRETERLLDLVVYPESDSYRCSGNDGRSMKCCTTRNPFLACFFSMNTKSCGFLGVRKLRSVPTAYKTAMMRGYRNPIQTHRVNVRIYPVPVAPLPD